MIFSVLSHLITSLALFGMALFVFLRNRKSEINFSFMLLCLSSALWQLLYEIYFLKLDAIVLSSIVKFWYIPVIFIAPTLYHFCIALIKDYLPLYYKKFIYANYIVALMFSLFFLTTDYFINGYYVYSWGVYPKAGILHPFFLIWFSVVCSVPTFVYLFLIRNKNILLQDKKILQVKYILFATFLYLIACVDFIPNYGVGIYPIGFIFAFSFLTIITVTILKHQLMDINIVIKKGVIYSVLAGIITAGYFIFVLIAGSLFQGLAGYRSFFVNLFVIFTIAILFNPLRNRIQHFLDKRFFKGTLESLSKERERLQQELFNAEKLARAGMIASSAVHEIKNPLTAIKTFTEYASEKIQDSEFKDRFTRLVPKEIERVEKVVHQLLELAKPRQPLFKEVKLHYVIDSTLTLLENNLKSKKVELKKDYQDKEITIPADEEQLCQVFLNLFLNAIDAMSDGGTLTVDTRYKIQDTSKNIEPVSCILNPELKNSYIEVVISDTGPGIPPETLDKLFTPFFTTKKEGTGLGLIITQEIIRAHNGMIKVESAIGKGTTFIIRLPISNTNYREYKANDHE